MRAIRILGSGIACTVLLLAASMRCSASPVYIVLNLHASGDNVFLRPLAGSGAFDFRAPNSPFHVDVTFHAGPLISVLFRRPCRDNECFSAVFAAGGHIGINILFNHKSLSAFSGTFIKADSNEENGETADFAGIFVLDGFAGKGILREDIDADDQNSARLAFSGTPAPEPGTLALLGTGLLGLIPLLRRPLARRRVG